MNKEERIEIAKKIIKAYESANFNELYPLFSDDILWCSQWVVPDRKGKEEIINYYENKAKLIKEGNSEIKGIIIETIEPEPLKPNPLSKHPRVILLTPAGKICAIIGQRSEDKEINMVLDFELNDIGQIKMISISDPSFYTFKAYNEEQ